MAVLSVLHNVPAANAPAFVDLPEDDIALARSPDDVVVVDAPDGLRGQPELPRAVASQPLPKGATRRVAARDELRLQRLQRSRRQLLFAVLLRHRRSLPAFPHLLPEILPRRIVVPARVLVVALAHLVVEVLEAVLGIHVAHEALPLSATGAGGLHHPLARQFLAL